MLKYRHIISILMYRILELNVKIYDISVCDIVLMASNRRDSCFFL